MKILIIDDSIHERQRHKLMLRTGGIETEMLEAENGREGIEILRDHHAEIDIIILDWHMPILDGPGFLAEFQQNPDWARIKVIMSTTYGADERKTYIRRLYPPLAGYVVKPYQPETMLQLIKAVRGVKS